eukprot:CAMPEP_0113934376 /NCGR_PEP_ID=MMETSP1339-20121228/1707_1 /TAXON_ID=94617 /ORGANISM="Fibrocapsa japonica" /LENGTH=300 /DNA_ID=CAMNT_0000936157 /DNA_START=71 /DNA_END=973 /DNA_ORIENTATION=- /assembly_acc=CAM_ASM_000762
MDLIRLLILVSCFLFSDSLVLPHFRTSAQAVSKYSVRLSAAGDDFEGIKSLALKASTQVAEDTQSSSTKQTAEALHQNYDPMMELPWSEVEDWIIQDSISNFVVNGCGGRYIMWRRFSREMPELAGRHPMAVRQRWLELSGRENNQGVENLYLQPPILEDWEVEGDPSDQLLVEQALVGGGSRSCSGRVQGLQGVADGSFILTAPVTWGSPATSIEDQYITTTCGAVFELGTPRQAPLGLPASQLLQGNLEAAADLVTSSQSSSLIANVGKAATAMALMGSSVAALATLTKHLDVNVFIV